MLGTTVCCQTLVFGAGGDQVARLQVLDSMSLRTDTKPLFGPGAGTQVLC